MITPKKTGAIHICEPGDPDAPEPGYMMLDDQTGDIWVLRADYTRAVAEVERRLKMMPAAPEREQ